LLLYLNVLKARINVFYHFDKYSFYVDVFEKNNFRTNIKNKRQPGSFRAALNALKSTINHL